MKINYFVIFFVFIFSSKIFSQAPANDDCVGAIDLGILGAPPACGTFTQNGAITTIAATNVGTTPENPYLVVSSCNMAAPANSVWYKYTVPTNGYGVKIVVSNGGSTLANPNIALWSGSCGALDPKGCVVGSAGSATLNLNNGFVIGNTYYIQVSGNTGQSGTFNLSVNSYQDCTDCLILANITQTPLPVDGYYNPGQSVEFCYHVDKWKMVNTNWLHGVQLVFGNDWDISTLTTTAAISSGTCGVWGYYPSGISTSTVSGFYFDGNCTMGPGSIDGNPANNFGDPNNNTGGSGTIITTNPNEWKFCWTVSTKTTCTNCSNITVTVNTTGDGETGSWMDPGCTGDSPTTSSPGYVTKVLSLQNSNNFKVFPNPARDLLNLVFAKNLNQANVRLINILGVTVIEKTKLTDSKVELNISTIANGFYLLEIEQNGLISTVRVLKE